MRFGFVFGVWLLLFLPQNALGWQEIIVEPFLQQATANSIWVVWETDQGDESSVEFGLTNTLGQTQSGKAIPNVGTSVIHQVRLVGLTAETEYFYRVKTGATTSEIFNFRTPAPSSSGYPLRFAAYSDSQIDGGNPNKHQEIINDGIIDFVTSQYGPKLWEELDFVMVPGDLVSTGNNHSHWTNHFFGQAKNLYRHVPLYPVPGNHEGNSPLYFRYFNLPENGTPNFLEHWYYHDQGNVRIIGLDSNSGFRIQEQLDWLDNVLLDAANNQAIQFVFAQLHHPHKSELWTPGESSYTGEVIQRLEQFTTSANKPSIHFFGHTHGYSRGQSKDHNHLWVNVASGGGNIDYWGEFSNADYPEFQISSPEYGFTIVEVEAGENAQFVMKRISRGNEIVAKDNEIVDQVTIRLNNTPPDRPQSTGCTTFGQDINPDSVVLEATPFADSDGDFHLASQFQIAAAKDGFDSPTQDVWLRFENWYSPADATGPANGYFSVNTVEDSDITQANMGALEPDEDYFWRVRYRDSGLVWSEWSEPQSFSTGTSEFGPNLLTNPGAEDGTSGWQIVDSPLESLTENECASGTSPVTGDRFFAIGGVCNEEGPYGEAIQTIDVSNRADAIDAGNLDAIIGGQLKNFNGSDRPSIWLVFKDSNNQAIGNSSTLEGTTSTWTKMTERVDVPVATRNIEFHLAGTRFAGTDNDSYADDVSLQLTEETDPFVVSPESFEVTKGLIADGDVTRLSESDNQDLQLFRNPGNVQSTTEFLISATSPNASPTEIQFTLEGAVFARTEIEQTIELYNFHTSAFEIVSTEPANRAPAADLIVSASPDGDASCFVGPNLELRAKIKYQSNTPRAQFSSNTDHVFWTLN